MGFVFVPCSRIMTSPVLPPSLDLCRRRGTAAALQVQPAPTPRALHQLSLHKQLFHAAFLLAVEIIPFCYEALKILCLAWLWGVQLNCFRALS